MSKITIPEIYNLIQDPLMDFKQEFVMPNKELLQDAWKYVNLFPLTQNILAKINNPKLFYKTMPDMKYEIPKELHNCMFYLMKFGSFYEGVEWEVAYPVKYVLDNHGTINELANVCDSGTIYSITATTDFMEKVNRVAGRKVEFITEYKYKVANGNYYDIYIQSTDRVAIVCKEIAQQLTFDDIVTIEEKKGKLFLDNIPLATLSGGVGASSGVYDLSRVL